MIDSDWLLESARQVVNEPARGRPHQTMLRRAVSNLYYALFHEVCKQAADLHVGATPATRRSERYALVYRMPEHGRMKSLLRTMQAQTSASAHAQHVASVFVNLQEARHLADYDPRARFRRAEVAFFATDVDLALTALRESFPDKEILLTRVIARER